MSIGKRIQSVIAVAVTSAALLLGGMNAVTAATVPVPPQPRTTSQLQTPEQIQTAISEAFDGDGNRLALLLESPQVSETQAALRIRLEGRGDFSGGHFLANKKAPGGAIAPMSTGPVSIGCAYAGFGVIVSLMGPIGAIGWAAYGAGVLFAAGGVVISCG